MLPEQTSQPLVELRYTLSREDLVDGFTVHQRVARRSWWQRPRLLRLLITAGMLIFVVLLGLFKGMSGAQLVVFVLVTAVAAGVGLVVARPLDPNRLMHWLAVRRIMAGNPVFAEPMECRCCPSEGWMRRLSHRCGSCSGHTPEPQLTSSCRLG